MLAMITGMLMLLGGAGPPDSPWNGSWRFDPARSSAAARNAAARGYRFKLSPDGSIRWEIPSLDEVVEGRVDGKPMVIKRPNGTAGMTLSVRREGSRVMLYQVAKDGVALGEGRMTLVDGDRAWVDIVWAAGHPETAHQLVYIRQ